MSDGGDLQVKITRADDGGVLMLLSKSVGWIALTPEAAKRMAHMLLEKAQDPEERTPQ